MLSKRAGQIIAACTAVALSVLIFSSLYGLTKRVCEEDAAAGQKNCSVYSVPLFFVVQVGKALNDYGVALTAVTTALLAYTTFLLVRLGREQSETTRAQLRAYVNVIGKDLIQPGPIQPTFTNQLEIRNVGATPAYKVRIESATRPLPYPLGKDFDFAITPAGRNPSVMMLGPGRGAGHDSYSDPLSPAESVKIKTQDSGSRLYTFGTVNYEDVFRRKQHTNFCFFVEFLIVHTYMPGTGFRQASETFTVHPTEEHNDAS
jgi:hypothetical protein